MIESRSAQILTPLHTSHIDGEQHTPTRFSQTTRSAYNDLPLDASVSQMKRGNDLSFIKNTQKNFAPRTNGNTSRVTSAARLLILTSRPSWERHKFAITFFNLHVNYNADNIKYMFSESLLNESGKWKDNVCFKQTVWF